MMVYVDEYFKDDGVGERLGIKRGFAEALIQISSPTGDMVGGCFSLTQLVS